MDDHIGAAVVLHHRPGAGTVVGDGVGGMLGDAGPQAAGGLLFGEESVGADEAAGVTGFAGLERHCVHE